MSAVVNAIFRENYTALFALIFGVIGCSVAQAAEFQSAKDKAGALHVYSNIVLASPVISIEKIESDWANIHSARYIQAKARLGSQFYLKHGSKQVVSFGIESRFDYLLHFDPQSAYFYQKLENQNIQAGTYDLNIDINSVWSHGFFAQYFIPLSYFGQLHAFSMTAHILKPKKVQQGELLGSGQVNANESFTYGYQLDYLYDENRLTESLANDVSGWGHSFDFIYEYNNEEGFSARVAMEDVFYTYYWQSVNQDVGCLSRPIAATCFVKTVVHSAVQKLPYTVVASLTQRLNSNAAFRLNATQWSRFKSLTLGGSWKEWGLEQDVLNDITQLSYESDMVRLKLATDKVNLSQAKHWQLALDIVWPIL